MVCVYVYVYVLGDLIQNVQSMSLDVQYMYYMCMLYM